MQPFAAGDATIQTLASLPHLKYLYLTDTKVTPAAVAAFRKEKPASFVSWARRPETTQPAAAQEPKPKRKGNSQ